MARKFLTAIDLAQNELQNAQVQNLGSPPGSPKRGQLYYNNTGGNDTLYWWDGTLWQNAKGATFGTITQEQTFGASKTDGVATTAARSDHGHGNPVHDAAAHSAIPVSALAAATANLNMGTSFRITNLSQGVAGTDAATVGQLQSAVQGLSWKSACQAATTANISLTGDQTVDGIANVGTLAYRVLVKNQTTTSQNGIYQAAAGAWTRVTDMDLAAEFPGAATYVTQGTVNADTAWTVTAPDTSAGFTVDSGAVTWAQFSGASAATAGAGLTAAGNVFNVVAADTSLTVNADNMQVNTAVIATVASLASYTPTSRTLTTTAPLTGGGDLSANRTLAVNTFGAAQAGVVPQSGGGTTTFLRADGTWAAPAGGGTVNKFAQDCAAATSTVVTHNLNSSDVTVAVYTKASTFDEVDCDVQHTSVNSVTVLFATAPTAGQYRIVCVG